MKYLLLLNSLLSLICVGCASLKAPAGHSKVGANSSIAAARPVHIVDQGPKNCQYLADYELDTADPKFQEWLRSVTEREGGNYFVIDKMWLDGQIFLCPEGAAKGPSKKAKRSKTRSTP